MQADDKSIDQSFDKSRRILLKMDIIKPKITFMISEYGLSDNYVSEIDSGIKQILEDDENFVVQNIFSVLLPKSQGEIIQHLFNSDKLRKVFNIERTREDLSFSRMSEEEKEIIEHVEQVSYTGGSYIIREGEPLDMIFFIALGTVVTYLTKYDGSCGSSSTTIELKKGEWYGQKYLFPWATGSSSNFSNLPISTITVKSHRQVDIFAFKAIYLKNIVSKFPGILKTELHHSTNSTGQTEITVENS